MSKPKLALIPSGYKGSTNPTVYSILPNDASGDFDYERNGNATRVRKDGLIEELTVDDTPRLDWLNSDCPSLKLEPQRTNLITYSEDFSNGWSYFDSSIDANVLISPSGVLNASKFIEGNGASIKPSLRTLVPTLAREKSKSPLASFGKIEYNLPLLYPLGISANIGFAIV